MLAIVFSTDFVKNISHAVYRWDSNKSLEGLALVLGVEASLIAGLLVLKTYQNVSGGFKRSLENFEVPCDDSKELEETK